MKFALHLARWTATLKPWIGFTHGFCRVDIDFRISTGSCDLRAPRYDEPVNPWNQSVTSQAVRIAIGYNLSLVFTMARWQPQRVSTIIWTTMVLQETRNQGLPRSLRRYTIYTQMEHSYH
jgi:hypothetical protein